MQVVELYETPELYDALVQRGPCEAFYGELARQAGGPVLEVACGTGRLANALAAEGAEVTGLDLSDAMLGRAAANAARLGVSPRWVKADMRSFTFPCAFELIVLGCSSLCHMTTHADVLALFGRVRAHLAPGGRFAFDVANPQLGELAEPGARGPCWISTAPGFAAQEELIDYDPISQIRRMGWTVRAGFDRPVTVAPLPLRTFFAQEIELLLDRAGLRLAERYGDFSKGPLRAESAHQVCVTETR